MDGFYSMNISPEYFIKKEGERKALKRLGAICGVCLCLYVLIQNVLGLVIQLAGFWDEYESNSLFQTGADIIMAFAGILLPFFLLSRLMKKYSSVEEPLVFERQVSRGTVALAVVSGLGLCMAANIVSSVFITIASVFGFQLTSPDIPMPTGVSGFFLSFIRTVVVAAMAEELALRGYTMGHLRKYGDGFAISTAAAVFAIMHGNLVQAPFAFLVGLAIGYFTVKTGSLWTAIFIHAGNNFISLALAYLLDAHEDAGTLLYALLIYGLSFVGVICCFIFVINTKNKKLYKSESTLSFFEKLWAYFFNVPMVIALLIMLYITSTFVEFGW